MRKENMLNGEKISLLGVDGKSKSFEYNDFTIEYINGNLNGDKTTDSLENHFAMHINNLKEENLERLPYLNNCLTSDNDGIKSTLRFNQEVKSLMNSTPINNEYKNLLRKATLPKKPQVKEPIRNIYSREINALSHSPKEAQNRKGKLNLGTNFKPTINTIQSKFSKSRSGPNLNQQERNPPLNNHYNMGHSNSNHHHHHHQEPYPFYSQDKLLNSKSRLQNRSFKSFLPPQENVQNKYIFLGVEETDPNKYREPYAFYSQDKLLNSKSRLENRSFKSFLPPQENVQNKYIFLGVEETDPNKYREKYGPELINTSKFSNLNITKWAQTNNILPPNLRLAKKNQKIHVNSLFIIQKFLAELRSTYLSDRRKFLG